ncbi:MAG: nitroreductase family protein [Lachnospiraceae bacterium]|jgi:nitroreductase/NAD-dependent dihydropyrimidine dehydrogenase PreA subunit
MLIINKERCLACGTCVQECHRKALQLEGDELQHNPQNCIMCGHCLAVCPRDVIMIDGDGYDVEEVEDLSFAPLAGDVQMRNMILKRRSVRHFDLDVDVTDEEVAKILEAGKHSPTGVNRQGNAFVVVKSPEKRQELLIDTVESFRRQIRQGNYPDEQTKIFMQNIIAAYDSGNKVGPYYDAPVVVFVFADTDVDGAIAATTMSFMAQSLRLGTCYVRIPIIAYRDEEFAEKWQAFEGKKCVISMLIGNPASEYFCSVPRKTPPSVIF